MLEKVASTALESTRIHGTRAFSWLGTRVRCAPSLPGRGLSERAARAVLLHRLRATLYANYYCTGTPVPLGDDHGPIGPFGLTAFVEALSQANTGQGYFSPGWRVLSADGRHLHVAQDGLELLVPAGGAAARPDRDGTVQVWMPGEMLGISPGFYMAVGDAGPVPATDRGVRLYWHLSPEGAAPFVRSVTESLNAAGISFQVKVASGPAMYARADAGVLYLRAGDYPDLRPLLAGIHRRSSAFLRAPVPVLTKEVARGVGLAEDPGGGESFGMHRCRLLAGGLLAAHEATPPARSHEHRTAVVLDVLTSSGVEVEHPYREPGSTHDYAALEAR